MQLNTTSAVPPLLPLQLLLLLVTPSDNSLTYRTSWPIADIQVVRWFLGHKWRWVTAQLRFIITAVNYAFLLDIEKLKELVVTLPPAHQSKALLLCQIRYYFNFLTWNLFALSPSVVLEILVYFLARVLAHSQKNGLDMQSLVYAFGKSGSSNDVTSLLSFVGMATQVKNILILLTCHIVL